MSDSKSSVRCPACGMINWVTAEGCRRCGAWFGVASPRPSGRPRGAGVSRSRRALRAVTGTLVFVAVAGTLSTMGLTNMLTGTTTPEWQHFKSSRGNYSVRLPADPETWGKDYTIREGIEFKVVRADLSRSEGCSVAYADYPRSLDGVSTSEFEAVVRRMAAGTESEVVKVRPISLGARRGLELEAKTPANLLLNGRAYWRMYISGSRLYVLSLVGRADGELAAERDKFFDSFSVPASEDTGTVGD